jgi:hypothetical protein
MIRSTTSSFDEFFEDSKYVAFKNHLYNYRLRKRAVEKILQGEVPELILEVGSGISPAMTRTRRIIYYDFSFTIMKTLKQKIVTGKGVVCRRRRHTSIFPIRCFFSHNQF